MHVANSSLPILQHSLLEQTHFGGDDAVVIGITEEESLRSIQVFLKCTQ